jgi:sugar lactone lactonase YvrE
MADQEPQLAGGWRIESRAGGSPMIGANGVRQGPDGRVWVAQAMGSQVSAVDLVTGAIETIVPQDGDIVSPDDLAFDSRGNMYATEIMAGRVSMRRPDGGSVVLTDELVAPNGVTVHGDRVFIDEFRPGGRMFELYPDGRAPRLIAENLMTPNALCLSPDGHIYFPQVMLGEIWRVPVEGGEPERFVGGIAAPIAVKVDADGGVLTPASMTGELLRFDPVTRTPTRLAALEPGIDNFTFTEDGEIVVSHFIHGGLTIVGEGGSTRTLAPPAMLGPWALAAAPDGGVYVADGMSLSHVGAAGQVTRVSRAMADHAFPGFIFGVAAAADGALYLASAAGVVVAFKPGAESNVLCAEAGQVLGMTALPAGGVAACDAAGGRLLRIAADGVETLATGLGRPTGIAPGPRGGFFVADAQGGRVLHVAGGETAVVVRGLVEPHGVAVLGDELLVLDRGAKALVSVGLSGGEVREVARNLPVGPERGVSPHYLPGIPGIAPWPIVPFAGLAVTADGAVHIACDGDRSVMKIVRRG